MAVGTLLDHSPGTLRGEGELTRGGRQRLEPAQGGFAAEEYQIGGPMPAGQLSQPLPSLSPRDSTAAMFFRVDIAMPASQIAACEKVEKHIGGLTAEGNRAGPGQLILVFRISHCFLACRSVGTKSWVSG